MCLAATHVFSELLSRSWHIWRFPEMGDSQNGLFIMEQPIKMDDLELPPFLAI